MTTQFVPHVQQLPNASPFIGPETLERQSGKPFELRLGANESAFGISKLARSAIADAAAASACSWYGDPENHDVRTLLAERHSVATDNLCIDAGIDALLGLSVRLFIAPGQAAVTSLGAYPTFNYHVHGCGGIVHAVPYRDNHEDPIALIEAAHTHGARLVYLANPDNPMGTCIESADIAMMLDNLPQDCILLLDEAYVEFMDSTPPLSIDINDERLIRFRTFSKAFGMAGMRIGYVVAHTDIISGFNRIRNHFGVNRLAQIAAKASLEDKSFLSHVVAQVSQGRERIYAMANALNLTYVPSSTNFVTVQLGSDQKAASLLENLAGAGVFMRKPGMSPQSSHIRIGVGTAEQHQGLENILIPMLSGGAR